MESWVPYETYFCICETEFMGQKCRPGDRLKWAYPYYKRGIGKPSNRGVWAKVYFAPWKDSIGQTEQVNLEWQFIGDVTQDHLAVSLPDGAEPHQLFEIVDLGLYRGMEPFLSFCGNMSVGLIEATENFWSVYWSSPSEDEQLDMLLYPFRGIYADGKDEENPRIITIHSPATGLKTQDNLYALFLGEIYNGEYFFANSVDFIQWAEDIRFRPGALVNLGLAAYLEFQRLRKQTQSGLRFADFLLHKDRIFRNCFCLDEAPEDRNLSREKIDVMIAADKQKKAMAANSSRNTWALARKLFREYAKTFPEEERVLGLIPRQAICRYIEKDLLIDGKTKKFQLCLNILEKMLL